MAPCARAPAWWPLLKPSRYQNFSNGNGTFIKPLKYLNFMDGNKDKRGKNCQSRRYNGLIKADGHQKRDFLKILTPHMGNNVGDLTDVLRAGQAIKGSSGLL